MECPWWGGGALIRENTVITLYSSCSMYAVISSVLKGHFCLASAIRVRHSRQVLLYWDVYQFHRTVSWCILYCNMPGDTHSSLSPMSGFSPHESSSSMRVEKGWDISSEAPTSVEFYLFCVILVSDVHIFCVCYHHTGRLYRCDVALVGGV